MKDGEVTFHESNEYLVKKKKKLVSALKVTPLDFNIYKILLKTEVVRTVYTFLWGPESWRFHNSFFAWRSLTSFPLTQHP